MIVLKSGVRIYGLKPEILFAMNVADGLAAKRDVDLVITCVSEGQHKPGSLHYKGLAFDLRTRDWDKIFCDAFVAELRAALGSDFDVVPEESHCHVEFDPKEFY